MIIADNFAVIRRRIDEAAAGADRTPEEIRVVAAAKGQGEERIRDALAAGIKIVGHNYVQEAVRQKESMDAPDVEMHMIGHLQKNKAGKAVELFQVIQSVDGSGLASALDRRANAVGKIVSVMIQVNLSGETQKSGIARDRVPELAETIRDLPCLRLRGLMTMPPFFDDPERARPYFAALREFREELITSGTLAPDMTELSMGMTGDFEVAVREGATLVRIGTALFGPRG